MRILLALLTLCACGCGQRYSVADLKAAQDLLEIATVELAKAEERLELAREQKRNELIDTKLDQDKASQPDEPSDPVDQAKANAQRLVMRVELEGNSEVQAAVDDSPEVKAELENVAQKRQRRHKAEERLRQVEGAS